MKSIAWKLLAISILISFVGINCQRFSKESARIHKKLNSNWKFHKGDVENAQLTDYDDSKWRTVTLPHDWAIEGPFDKNVSYRGGFLPYPGVGWYRKTFEIEARGKNVLLEFDGVMREPKVWVNGNFVGQWAYGYTSFAFNITKYLNLDGKNVIAVRVENEDHSSRWYPGSGIYRNVWLTITNPVHVAHWGTFVTTPVVTDEKAIVKVETEIENQSAQVKDIVLETLIVDQKGSVVSKDQISGKVTAQDKYKFVQELKVQNPHRWDVNDPYLYRVISRVKSNDELIDNYETPFGIRTFRFDPNKGFFLNGRHLKIHGVNLHHGLGPLGIAVNKRAIERQIEIMKKMGANAIRTAHNPPAPELLDLCDKMGMLVLDETFDEWRTPKVLNGYHKMFDQWAEKDTKSMILRDRDHPSIILWSIGNEIPELGTKEGKKTARFLANICRKFDPTRPITAGIHLSTNIDRELTDIFNVIGLNYWQDRYEKIHKQFPRKPILATESAAVVSSRGEYHFPLKRIYSGYYDPSLQITSYDLVNCGFGTLPDSSFKYQNEFEFLAGQFVWSGFDYNGEPDPYENMWPAHSSYFGIVDMCGFPKDRYYLYQSVWTDKPMIHLLPHWNWAGREGEITPVYCYTNCASVELFVNGRSFGKKEKKAGEYRLKWENVRYQPGSIKAIGYDNQGNVLCEKQVKTAGAPFRILLIPDRKKIVSDGEDMSFVTVQIHDKDGNLCPLADNLVNFKIEGEGKIAAVGNGNPISLESYQAHQRKAFHGMCLVIIRATRKPGTIKLTASSSGLKRAMIVIKSEAKKN